ncbi:hypothetical protein ALT761_01885 [Alteromonas sp. 76-1]|jgi:hypothetical protein|uniref:Uncharacterized protein n=1 Tax=Alteromonas stellipolaris TaxID=233316 RepID=A0AAW7YUB1_9ALTE|nr:MULTISPECIES: hypothetical protein [Alteromonas]MDO6575935.1 hypothetical protein [Alteromonas stellipolaris]VEL96892.1 hypothetical protein ALT761_01885 [Alteromonas sp. 76-1]
MESINLNELRELLKYIAFAGTKKEASTHLRKLKSKESKLKGVLNGYTVGKLSEAINFADQAAGNVKNKEELISHMESSWSVFESDINNGTSGRNI